MKTKLQALLHDYLLIILAYLPILFLIRLSEYLDLVFFHAVPGSTLKLEVLGYLTDNLLFFTYALILFIPFSLFYLIHKKAGNIFMFIFLLLYTLISLSLQSYFTQTMIPLDQVIFFYTPGMIRDIVLSSTRFSVFGIVAPLIVISSQLFLFFFLRKQRLPQLLIVSIGVVILLSPIHLNRALPDRENYQNDYDYFVLSNKLEYFVSKVIKFRNFRAKGSMQSDSAISEASRYHFQNPEFTYLNADYPLLRVERTPDALGPYFNFGKEKPNFVFIIFESLSTSFCGKDPYYGSFMPFLDSLIGKSLYWNNFLSTAERTFNVLPAVFGSLPFSNAEFYLNSNPPLHFSLIRYLKENGYFTTFYYGGNPSFSGYDNFMKHESIDLIMSHFGKNLSSYIIMEKSWEWGHPDGDLYKRSFEVLDSLKRSPRLDIYLTISSHAPFKPPDEEHYHQEFDKRVKKLNLRPDIKRMVEIQRDIFSTIIYTDQSLKEFFDTYRKRDDFKNTVFIITGDHAMPELNTTYLNVLEKYHVPLVIYSEMLKKPEWFRSVSSHLDIAPSILAMLKSHGFVATRPVCHWLGQGIDVSGDLRNTHKVSFIFNNGSQEEYIDGMNFISGDRLFQVVSGLKLKKVNNAPVAERLRREQETYLSVTNDVANKKIVVPDELYFTGNYLEEPYVTNSYKFDKTKTDEYYISLIPSQKLNDDIAFLKVDLSVDMQSPSLDTSKIPLLVFQLLDDNAQNHKWLQFYMDKRSHNGNIFKLELRKYIDLSMVRNTGAKTMKIYFLNNEKQPMILDKMQLDIKKIKLNDLSPQPPSPSP
jgi:phosphoglycerol transferase MdoB-like AlkP superfamily enzyme